MSPNWLIKLAMYCTRVLLNQIPKRRLSGIQKEILILYKNFLKTANTKQNKEELKEIIRTRFKENAKKYSVHNITAIEWQIRYAKSQLQMLKNANVSGVSIMK